MSAKELLTRKIGPLPTYGWIIGLGGGLLVAAYLRRLYNTPEADAGTTVDGAADGGDYISPSDGTGGAAVSDPNVFPDSNSGGSKTPQPPKTNNAWRKDAIRAGISFGYGALTSQRLIDKYLTGGTLTQPGALKVDRIIAQVGPPPSATPSPHVKSGQPKHGGKHDDDHDHKHHGGRPKTNGAWRERGVEALHRAGFTRPRVDEALSDYLRGHNLTGAQWAIVHAVIARLGPAPNPPKHAPGHKHPQHHSHPTNRRDTGAAV